MSTRRTPLVFFVLLVLAALMAYAAWGYTKASATPQVCTPIRDAWSAIVSSCDDHGAAGYGVLLGIAIVLFIGIFLVDYLVDKFKE